MFLLLSTLIRTHWNWTSTGVRFRIIFISLFWPSITYIPNQNTFHCQRTAMIALLDTLAEYHLPLLVPFAQKSQGIMACSTTRASTTSSRMHSRFDPSDGPTLWLTRRPHHDKPGTWARLLFVFLLVGFCCPAIFTSKIAKLRLTYSHIPIYSPPQWFQRHPDCLDPRRDGRGGILGWKSCVLSLACVRFQGHGLIGW